MIYYLSVLDHSCGQAAFVVGVHPCYRPNEADVRIFVFEVLSDGLLGCGEFLRFDSVD